MATVRDFVGGVSTPRRPKTSVGSVRTRLAAVLVGATLALGACASESTAPTDPEAPDRPTTTTTTDAADVTTTSTTTVATLGDDSRLSFAGIGPVRVGMTIEEAERAAGVPMRRIELPSCIALSPVDQPHGVEFIFPGGGPLVFAFARVGARIESESGIGIRDDEDSVLRAHPDAEVTNRSEEVHRLVVRESEDGRRLMFEIDRGLVTTMWSGPAGSEEATEICT